MKRTINLFLFIIATVGLVSCGSRVTSDASTEAEIVGEWQAISDEDNIVTTEVVTFYPDNTFKVRFSSYTSDFTPIININGKGVWKASDKILWQQIDIDKLAMTYTTMDYKNATQILNSLKDELKDPVESQIIEIGSDKDGKRFIKLFKDGQEETYSSRRNSSDSPDSGVIDHNGQETRTESHPLKTDYLYGGSYLKPFRGITYIPQNAFDGNTSTCWAIDKADCQNPSYDCRERLINVSIEGEYITGMIVWNGYQKSPSLYDKNMKPRQLLITIADPDNYKLAKTTIYSGSLKNTFGQQYIGFEKPIRIKGETVGIFIDDWYGASSPTGDLCLSEVQFLGY